MHRFLVRDFTSFSNAHRQKPASFLVNENAINDRMNVTPQTAMVAILVMRICFEKFTQPILPSAPKAEFPKSCPELMRGGDH